MDTYFDSDTRWYIPDQNGADCLEIENRKIVVAFDFAEFPFQVSICFVLVDGEGQVVRLIDGD